MNPLIPVEDLDELVEQLVLRWGSVRAAGRAYDERYGTRTFPTGGAGARLLFRIRHHRVRCVKEDTVDRLETLLWS